MAPFAFDGPADRGSKAGAGQMAFAEAAAAADRAAMHTLASVRGRRNNHMNLVPEVFSV
jgi:hypothetical protein